MYNSRLHSGAIGSTVALQQEGPGFDSQTGVELNSPFSSFSLVLSCFLEAKTCFVILGQKML